MRCELLRLTNREFQAIDFENSWTHVTQCVGERQPIVKPHSYLEMINKDVSLSDCSDEVKNLRLRFDENRVAATEKLRSLFNRTVFDGRLGNVPVVWNPWMSKDYVSTSELQFGAKRSARILISNQLNNTPWELCDTLIHEMCHAAVWLIVGRHDRHGNIWKFYTEKAMRIHRSMPFIEEFGPPLEHLTGH